LLMELGHYLEWAQPAKNIATISSTVVQIAQPFPDGLSFTPPASNINGASYRAFFIWACGFGVTVVVRLRR